MKDKKNPKMCLKDTSLATGKHYGSEVVGSLI